MISLRVIAGFCPSMRWFCYGDSWTDSCAKCSKDELVIGGSPHWSGIPNRLLTNSKSLVDLGQSLVICFQRRWHEAGGAWLVVGVESGGFGWL